MLYYILVFFITFIIMIVLLLSSKSKKKILSWANRKMTYTIIIALLSSFLTVSIAKLFISLSNGEVNEMAMGVISVLIAVLLPVIKEYDDNFGGK